MHGRRTSARTALYGLARQLGRLLSVLGLLLLGLLLGTLFTFWLFGKTIVEGQITKLMQTPVHIGSLSVDFTDFPLATLHMQQVEVEPTLGKHPLMTTQEATLTLDLAELYFNKKQKTVELIRLRGNRVYMLLDRSYRKNFQLFKPYDPDRKRPDEVRIHRMVLEDTRLDYLSWPTRRRYAFWLDSAELEMRNYRSQVLFRGRAAGRSRYLDMGGFRIMEDQPFSLQTSLVLDKPSKMIDFRNMELTLDESRLSLAGKLLMSGRDRYYDLHFGTNYGKVQTLLSFIPQQTRRLLANYKLSGQLSLSGTIVGVDDETTNPHIELAFRAKETEVKHRQSGNSVQHLQLSGHLTNGKRNSLETAELSIDSLWANFAGRPIFAQLRLSSLLDPFLEGRATATLEFGKVLSFLGQDTVMQGSGLLRIDLDLAGPLHHVGRPDELHAVHYRGGISLEDVALSLRHQPLELRHAYGRLALRGRALHTPSLTAQLNGQPLRLAATLHDFLSYAYGEERVLKLDANLQLDTLYIPALLSHTAQLGRQRGLAATQPFHPSALGMELPGWLAASLHLDARVIYLNQYAYQGVRGTLSLRDKVLSMQAFEIGGKKGRALLFGSLNSQQRAQNTFQLALDLNSEDLPLVLQDLGLWPARRPVPTSAVQVGGNLRLNGYATRSAQPRIQLHLALENGYFFQPVQRIFIRDVTLSALFTEQHLKDPRHTPIRIDTLYGVANQFPFWASLRLDDPATGQVRMRLRTEIGADVLLNYFSLPTVAQPQGTLAFWVELAGKLSDISDPKKLVKMPQRGDFRMQNVSFDLAPAGLPFRQLNAEMYYDGKGVEIRQMSGRMNGNSFRVRGTVYDILGFLYTDQPGLAAKFSFESDSLNLETFALLDRPRGDTAKLKQIDLPSQSEIVAHFSLGYAYYQRLQMRDMEMDVVLQGHLLQVRQARLRTCGGLLAARGQMDQTDPQQPVIYTHLELDQVDLHQVFASFDALGKQQLDSLGIQGRLSLAGDLHLHLQPRSSRVSLPKLANFSIRLDEGSIRNLGQFLKPNPLLNQQDLATPTYFSLRLDNVFLADSTLFMPSVEFISNKLNFTARGHYRLNDQLRYDLAVLLPKEEELAAADYYHTPKYYGKTVYVFRLTENPERDKGMRVKFLPLWALRNILRARPRSAADA